MPIDRKAAVIAAINHEETPLLPYRLDWEGDVGQGDIGQQLDAHFGSDDWRGHVRSYLEYCAYADDGIYRPGPDWTHDVYGCVWRRDRRPVHLEESVLKTPSLKGYRFPDPDELFPPGWEAAARENIENNADRFTMGAIGQGLFERCWALRGFIECLTDAAGEPEFFEELAEAVTEHQLQLIDRLLPLPLDGILLSDDWCDQRGVMIGPDRWREVLKPRIARLYDRIKSAGKFTLQHSCGSVTPIIPDLVEIGLDVLESVQPEAQDMDPCTLKQRFGKDIAFWGGLGSQSLIPMGTPDEVRDEVRRLAEHMRVGGGFIIAPSKSLQPETPIANAVVLVEEFITLGEEGQ